MVEQGTEEGKEVVSSSVEKAERVNEFIGHLGRGAQEIVSGLGKLGALTSKPKA